MARGGARPGAGRPKGVKARTERPEKPVLSVSADIVAAGRALKLSPLEYMLAVLNDETAEDARRDRMAQAAAPFVHARAGEATKKVDAADKAKRVAAGRFAPGAAPQLVVNNR